MQHVEHPFDPIYDRECRVLILGTLPSVKSRENDFYYGHPQNRFWRVMASFFGAPVPQTPKEKRELLLHNHVALWDVIRSCDICGSSDSSIRNAEPTELSRLLTEAPIERIFANGSKAAALYRKYQQPLTGIPITVLPSTSPANAAWSLEALCESWQEVQNFITGTELRPNNEIKR